MNAFRNQFSTGYLDSDGEKNVSPAQSSQIVAILSAGTFFGALMAAPLGDGLGRRMALIIAVGIFCFGVIFQTIAMEISLLLAGRYAPTYLRPGHLAEANPFRFFAGVGVGTVSVLVPLYQSEMAPKWVRGTLVCAYQLAITTGLLLAAVVNIITHTIDGVNAFRIPLALQFVWGGILVLGLMLLPETPRYLIKRGRPTAAAMSLSRLRRLDITHPALIEELAEIEANHEYELSLGPSTYKDVFVGSPRLGRRILTGCGLQMLQQLCGPNFIFYYGTSFFENLGVHSPFLIQLIINLVNFTSTIPGMALVEAFGRRRLLMIGAAGMAVTQLTVACVGTAVPEAYAADIVLVVFVCLFIFFFAASWGPVTWVVTSEIYPLKVRAKSMSISVASNWLLNFAIAYGTPYMVEQGRGYAGLGPKVFFIWGGFCVIAFVFVWCMIFETSRISLEQIDELYERVDHAWNSKNFQPSWSFQEMRDEGVSASGVQPQGMEMQTPDGSETHILQMTSNNGSIAESGTSMTEEEKIVAQLGHVDFSF